MADALGHIVMSEPISSAQAIHDSGYGALAHIVLQREFGLGVTTSLSSNYVRHVVIGELSVGSRHDSCGNGVVMISNSCGPFEIGPDIIPLDSIDVIDLDEVIRVWDECSSDKLVDCNVSLHGRSSEVDVNVSSFVGEKFHFPAKMPLNSVAFGAGDAIKTSHSAHVADFVKCSVLGDGNMSPFFGGYGVHQGNLSLEMPASFNMAYVAIQDGDVRCL